MNVPAWPMPIHQTKLMIPNAQATGMLLPQTPMPVGDRVGDRDASSSERPSAGDARTRGHQPAASAAATPATSSCVGERGVGGPSPTRSGLAPSAHADLRVGVVDAREVHACAGAVPSSWSTA